MQILNEENILKVLNFRHACKAFDPNKKISDEDFGTIMQGARLSASSFGFEPWNFVVLNNKNIKEKMLDLTWGRQDALKNASHFVLILAKTQENLLPNSSFIKHMMNDVQKLPANIQEKKIEFYTVFQQEHFKLLENKRATFDWACKQCYIALANMMFVAALRGIDSLPIEGFHQDNVNILLEKEGVLNTKESKVCVMLALGYRLNPPKHAKSRQNLEDIVKYV